MSEFSKQMNIVGLDKRPRIRTQLWSSAYTTLGTSFGSLCDVLSTHFLECAEVCVCLHFSHFLVWLNFVAQVYLRGSSASTLVEDRAAWKQLARLQVTAAAVPHPFPTRKSGEKSVVRRYSPVPRGFILPALVRQVALHESLSCFDTTAINAYEGIMLIPFP